MGYTIGVSSGWWSIPKTPDLLGLGKKTMSAATYGVTFVQVDLETFSEFREPKLLAQLENARKNMGMDFGIHGEYDFNMEAGAKDWWDIAQERLVEQLRGAAEVKASYIHFHASSMPPPTFGGTTYGRFVRLVGLDGNTLYNLVGRVSDKSKCPWLTEDNRRKIRKMILDSFLYGGLEPTDPDYITLMNFQKAWQSDIHTIRLGRRMENISSRQYDILLRKLRAFALDKFKDASPTNPLNPRNHPRFFEISEQLAFRSHPIDGVAAGNMMNSYRTNPAQLINQLGVEELALLSEYPEENLIEEVESARKQTETDQLNALQEMLQKLMNKKYIPFFGFDERLSYEIVARFLEGSDIWNTICNTDYVKNQLTEQWKQEGRKFDPSVDLTAEAMMRSNDRKVQATLATMVAIEFINGHFNTPMQYRDPTTGKFVPYKGKNGNTVKDFIKDNNLVVTFETPQMISEKQEGLLRITRSAHIYQLVKKLRESPRGNDKTYLKDNMFMSLDFEHMLTHNLDIEQEIRDLPKDGGSCIRVMHVGQPKPIHPAHAPINVGSDAQELVYAYLYELRKKGFKDGWIIFERGGGQSPAEWMGSSVDALRLIVEYLEKDVNPDKLPPEFYGVTTTSHMSYERQRETMESHFFDPLKGTLAVPEEEFTFLGKMATEKAGVTPEKWKKEELR